MDGPRTLTRAQSGHLMQYINSEVSVPPFHLLLFFGTLKMAMMKMMLRWNGPLGGADSDRGDASEMNCDR
jgi:hypothetical protein